MCVLLTYSALKSVQTLCLSRYETRQYQLYHLCANFRHGEKAKRREILKSPHALRAGGVIGDAMKMKLQKINLIVLAFQQR